MGENPVVTKCKSFLPYIIVDLNEQAHEQWKNKKALWTRTLQILEGCWWKWCVSWKKEQKKG